MDEIKLSDDVIEQIKDFTHWKLTEEQESLIDKLITDKELKKCYKRYGLCENCKQPRTRFFYYCNYCIFQPNFKNWTTQLKATVWKDGHISDWDYNNNKWTREGETKVALKCLHNSQDITSDFLKEVESNILVYSSTGWIVHCFGITKDTKTNDFMMVMELKDGSLRQYLNNYFISLNWHKKLHNLQGIASCLKDIYNKGLIHHDFHCGNILGDDHGMAFVTDLRLCQPANVKSSQNSNKKIYGVLVPYVAPEVLKGKEYTQKNFVFYDLTEEQESLIDKLITDEKLKERYKGNGLCEECNYIKIWRFCNYCCFQQNFKNWTSGNNDVDEFIQKAQLKASNKYSPIEWIEYDKFENVEYLAKGGFGTTFKAVWKDGRISYCGYENNQFMRVGETKVALKCLHNSQGITAEFLKEVESNILVYNTSWIVRCFGITKDPKTNDFMMVMDLKDSFPPYYDIAHDEFLAMKICKGLRPTSNYKIPQLIFDIINQCWNADPLKRPDANELHELIMKLFRDIADNKVDSVVYGQVKEADEINKESSSTVQSPLSLSSTSASLLYTTHPQAVYTSRLLDFKNLPEPKNADNNDFHGVEYSDSLKVDFTKLDINSKDERN
ncbi:hypothetical protein RhiirA1_472623 [Rhizophagus irregularis]|uniref:Protein kinase domain-containing protein n=1 Tax=Rhizophagus irregularis TaxID=588596 RepID=A0A2N0R228_9GLOM|nr:hypothetical protein RhiirA1_472623 [Rhizophagus irregularis]